MYVIKIDRPKGEAQPVYIADEADVNWSDIGEVLPKNYEMWEDAERAAREWEEALIVGM